MSGWSVTRRLLLGHGVSAGFLLPAGLVRAATTPVPVTHKPGAHPRQAPQSPAAPPPLVMLDPGHGGKDPGAIGISGTYEKHVALAAAQQLQALLQHAGQYRVELTRRRDVFIPLEERVARAQGRGAALFVSMHADALADHQVRGASVYTLATTASDAQSAALAQRENSADRFAGSAFHGVPPEVARILASLVRQETRLDSARLQHGLVGELDRDIPMLQNPARHAGFVVLKAAEIPSVLVEMGFMSNRQDEAELRRPEHRARVVLAMKRAVDAYFATAGHATRMAG